MLKSWIYVCLFGLAAGMDASNIPDPIPTPTSGPTPIPENLASKYGVIINNGKTAVCLGAIVARNKVVTAAHCVRGASNLSVGHKQKTFTINDVIIHPFYKPPLFDYDIAVLKIETGSTDNLEAMYLSDKENEIPEKVNVTKITKMDLVGEIAKKEGRQTCQSKHGSKIRISTKMICAQFQQNVLDGSALYYEKNDSGSKTYLAGVALYSSPNTSLPIIFTNIANSEIYKFIDRYI